MNYNKKGAGISLRTARQVLNNGFKSARAAIAGSSGLLKSPAVLGVMAALLMPMVSYGVAVTTQHNNNYRTGQNDQETVLKVSNVNVNTFGKLYSLDLAALANLPAGTKVSETQALYVPNINITGKGVHNIIFICTLYNSCFALDADTKNTVLWQTSLGPVLTTYNKNNQGVRSTPVIDVASNTMYVVAKSTDAFTHFKLHALDISTGLDKPNSPVELQGSVFGRGDGSKNGILTFNPFGHSQRTGLLLLKGNIYIAFSGLESNYGTHGWVFSYNAKSLQFNSVMSTSPDWNLSSIWQDGNGIAADDKGYIYLHSANSYGLSAIGSIDYSNSLLKIDTSNNGLNIVDYFTPTTHKALNTVDADLSSSGPLLIPGTSLSVGGGKEGKLYVSSTNNLGKYSTVVDQVLQSWGITTSLVDSYQPAYVANLGIWGGNVYYDGSNRFTRPGKIPLYSGTRKGILFVWGRKDNLKSVNFTDQSFDQINIAQSNTNGLGGAAMSISSNGIQPNSAILWASGNIGGYSTGQGFLRAFDASNISNLLWDSRQNLARDDLCGVVIGVVPPTIANGKVFVPNVCGQIMVYGLLPK
jgi:hypothetical protein